MKFIINDLNYYFVLFIYFHYSTNRKFQTLFNFKTENKNHIIETIF